VHWFDLDRPCGSTRAMMLSEMLFSTLQKKKKTSVRRSSRKKN
jgi:hypothetical protein